MEEIRKLIKEAYPGYAISCIEQYYRPGCGWKVKLNYRKLADMKPADAMKLIKAVNATRICVRLFNKQTMDIQRPDINIYLSKPTI